MDDIKKEAWTSLEDMMKINGKKKEAMCNLHIKILYMSLCISSIVIQYLKRCFNICTLMYYMSYTHHKAIKRQKEETCGP